MSSSPQEKEKLRKRLQKLFQKQEALKKAAIGKINMSSQQKDNMEKENSKSPKKTPTKENNSKPNKTNSKNVTKQDAAQESGSKISMEGSKHNGFMKSPKKRELDSNLTKSERFVLKKDKQKQSKIQKEQGSVVIKEKSSSRQQSDPNNETLPNAPKNKNKLNKTKSRNKKVENINCEKIEDNSFESHRQCNVPKSPQASMCKQSDSVASGYTKIDKIRKKKVKKRAHSKDKINNKPLVSNKKQKLAKKAVTANNMHVKSNQQQNIPVKSDTSSSQFGDEYDVNGMTGYERGSDSDANYDENEYSSINVFQGNNVMQRLKNILEPDLEDYDDNESYKSDDCFDNEYSVSSELFSDLYEDEFYSDSGEDDYEDEDCYNYTVDSDNDYSSNFAGYDDDLSYDFDDDSDYELPEHVPEDLIINRGTAIIRELKPGDNVAFDNEESQIVELKNQHTVKVIYQPKAYEKEELLKLKYEEKPLSSITSNKGDANLSDSVCPKLVPIVDEDGFQLFNSNGNTNNKVEELEQEETDEQSLEEYYNDSMDDVSLGSEYTEIDSDDADSSLSEDINEKYINRGNDDTESSDGSIDDNMCDKNHKVDIIDATGYKCERKVDISSDPSDDSLNDDIMQIPSIKLYENVDLKTESSILSTTVNDSDIFSNENIDETNQTLNTQYGTSDSTSSADEAIEKIQIEKENRTEQSPTNSKPCRQNLANYNTKFFNALNSNLVMVLLKDPFYIYGTVRLTLLAGAVEVYGHSLSLNKEVELFSPRGCSVIEIASTHRISNISTENVKQLLEPYEQHFTLDDLNRIANLYDYERDSVVLLKRNESRKKVVQQFKKFMNENVFPNISNINVDRPLYNSEYILRCMINTSAQEQKCLRLPAEWQLLSISSKSRVMLAGGKGVGKSTLLRYLINRHLPQKILLIDLDIGQPEVFIPQTISCTIVKQPLLGPGFLLNLQPEISYAVGHTNISLCAHKYIKAVHCLIAHCKAQEEYKEMPWLINTMGYNKGFGLELISVIAKELSLTDVIQLQSTKEINNFDSILHDHVLSSVPHILFPEECDKEEQNIKNTLQYRLHVWQSAVQQESRYQKEWEMSAKDLRFAILLARLSDALVGHADWLTDIKPLSASLDEIKIINLVENNPSASMEELEKSIEANLVYLCQYEENFKALKCLGIGIVRAIDFNVRQVYLIPALPHIQLKDVNCLAIGEMPLPSSLLTNQGPRVKNIAPFVYNTIAANASKAIKQIYHRPSKFLTGKHSTLD